MRYPARYPVRYLAKALTRLPVRYSTILPTKVPTRSSTSLLIAPKITSLLGLTIIGEKEDGFGTSLSMSGKGTIIAIEVPEYFREEFDYSPGYV